MTKATSGLFRKTFITGLLTLIPIAVTGVILYFLFTFLDNWLAPLVNELLRLLRIPLPRGWKTIPGLGILATVILVFFTGLISTNYIGRFLLSTWHALMNSIPVVKNVYGGATQLVQAFSGGESAPFHTVVMLEFSRPGLWVVGFVSNESSEWAREIAGADLVNVFIPVAPIPAHGLFVMVPRKELRVLPISTEEAFKLIATLGLVQDKTQPLKSGV